MYYWRIHLHILYIQIIQYLLQNKYYIYYFVNIRESSNILKLLMHFMTCNITTTNFMNKIKIK